MTDDFDSLVVEIGDGEKKNLSPPATTVTPGQVWEKNGERREVVSIFDDADVTFTSNRHNGRRGVKMASWLRWQNTSYPKRSPRGSSPLSTIGEPRARLIHTEYYQEGRS